MQVPAVENLARAEEKRNSKTINTVSDCIGA